MTGFGVRVERLHCPIGSCGWTHDRESPPQTTHTFPGGQSPLHNGPPATLQEAIADAAYATLLADALEVEGVVRAHLETHDLLDWVREVMRLRAERPTRWPQDQRIPFVIAGQTHPGGYAPEWWQAVQEYRWSRGEEVPAGYALTAAGINEALTWWNRRADALARGNTDAFEQIEAPERATVEQRAEQVRAFLAEDAAVARDVEHGGEWFSARHDELPLVQVNVVTADDDGSLDEYVAEDVGRSDGVHIARHDPARILEQCGALGDVLTELERIADRSPDPDSRMWARGAIHTLARVWEPDEDAAPLHELPADGHVTEGRDDE